MSPKTKNWLKFAGLRALRTFGQAFIATVGTSAFVMSDVSWSMVLSSSCLAALLSLATSLAGLPEVNGDKEVKGDKA